MPGVLSLNVDRVWRWAERSQREIAFGHAWFGKYTWRCLDRDDPREEPGLQHPIVTFYNSARLPT